MAAIVEFMAAGCGCDFTADRLTDRVFLCPPSSPQSVTYQVQLHGTLQAPVTDLITLMKEWASSGVTIPVQLLTLTVDGGCASLTSSTAECEVTESTQTEEGPFCGSQTTSVLVGVVVVVVVVLVVVIVVMVIILTVKQCRAKLQPKDGPE